MAAELKIMRSTVAGRRPPDTTPDDFGKLFWNDADGVLGIIDASGSAVDLTGGAVYLPLTGGVVTGRFTCRPDESSINAAAPVFKAFANPQGDPTTPILDISNYEETSVFGVLHDETVRITNTLGAGLLRIGSMGTATSGTEVGEVRFTGPTDSATSGRSYARLVAGIIDPTAGEEDGFIEMQSMVGGGLTTTPGARVDYIDADKLPSERSIVTRRRGDLRYLQAAGGTATGRIRIDPASPGVALSIKAPTGHGTALLGYIEDEYGDMVYRFDGDGSIPQPSSVLTRTTGDARYAAIASAARFKDYQAPSHVDPAVLDNLTPKSWAWNRLQSVHAAGTRGYGLIAEDVEKVLPEAVVRGASGEVVGLNPLTLIGLLVEALQETRDRLALLEARS